MIGKLITAEIKNIISINCLIINFIKYHFAIITIPTKKHKAKNTYNPTSPNAILAYVLKNISTGDPSAKYKEKKKRDHKIVIPIPNLYLLSIKFFFFLLLAIYSTNDKNDKLLAFVVNLYSLNPLFQSKI
jgi:hypothetical protein